MKFKSDDYYFKVALNLAEKKATCLKIKTGVVIVKNGKIVGSGFNTCSPEGFSHGSKVKTCKRLKAPTGKGYELCKSIHAEVSALINAGKKSSKGATLYLSGHYYPCWSCESHARAAGIKEIKVRDSGAKAYYLKSEKGL